MNPADAPSRRPDYMRSGDADEKDASRGLLATLEAKISRIQQIRTSRRRVFETHDEVLQAPGKPCEYGSEPGRQAEQGPCEYDSESGRQEPRNTCEYDSESGRQVLSE